MTTRTTSKEPTIELLRGPITYQSAIQNDQNIIHEATYVASNTALDAQLWKARDAIAAITKQHLNLGHADVCVVAPTCRWLRGSFNVCIPIEVQSRSLSRKLMFRCAMPYKLAEADYPGTVDEKVSCEVGTYAWMQEKCNDVRIPFLYGFGFSDHRHVRKLGSPSCASVAGMLTRKIGSSRTTHIAPGIPALRAGSAAFFTASSGLQRLSLVIPASQPPTVCPPRICSLNMSAPTVLAKCFPKPSRSREGTRLGGRIYFEVLLD